MWRTKLRLTQSICKQQVLRLMVSDDVIEIHLPNKTLIVNQVTIPLAKASDPDRHNQSAGFSLSSCQGDLLYARAGDNGTLEVELPLIGLMLDIHSEDEIIIKVRTHS